MQGRYHRLKSILFKQIWPPNAWKTLGFTWLWLAWCVFPGMFILQHLMGPGQHIAKLFQGGCVLLFYGAIRSIVESFNRRDGYASPGRITAVVLVALVPLLIGSFGVITIVHGGFGLPVYDTPEYRLNAIK